MPEGPELALGAVAALTRQKQGWRGSLAVELAGLAALGMGLVS